MNMIHITYAVDGEISVVFNRNCFYRAMLSICGTSHGPVSVRLSVTSWCSIETAERIAGFWHVSFLPPVLHCVKRKFGYLQK